MMHHLFLLLYAWHMAGVGWLDPREAGAWRALQRMHGQLHTQLARELARASSLSYPDYLVLVVLTERPGDRIRPFEIAELLGWEQSRLAHHLARMAARGLVEKEPCDADRRGAFVVATEAGRREIAAAAPGHVASVRRLFLDRLNPAQLDAVRDAAEAVLAGLADECEQDGAHRAPPIAPPAPPSPASAASPAPS